MNGRNVWNLATTTPAVLNAGTSDIGQSFRGAGQREIQNSLSLDGINSSANLLAATSMRPIAEAVTALRAAGVLAPIVVGGSAIPDAAAAARLGADRWAAACRSALDLLTTSASSPS